MELLNKILSDENLDEAINKVIKNKGSNGVDKNVNYGPKERNGYRETLS